MLTDKQIRETIRQYVEEASEQFYEEHLTTDARDRDGYIDFLVSQVSALHNVLARSNFTGDQHVVAG